MLFLWISPVVVFVALLWTRTIPALPASIVSLALAVVVGATLGPVQLGAIDVLHTLSGGAWIALPAVLVVLAGLFFTEVTAPVSPGRSDGTERDRARRLGTTCLFAGPFIETATGFGVGFVVALRAILALGVPAGPALALAAFSQCLVPWGALGVGTRISAAIVGIPVADIGWRAALVAAPVLLAMVPLYWRVAAAGGVRVPLGQKLEDICLMAGLVALLATINHYLPLELAGMVAIGPWLALRLWMQAGRNAFSFTSLASAVPYLVLIGLLASTQLIPSVEAWLASPSLSPGHGAPLFAPLASPAWPLLLSALFAALVPGLSPGGPRDLGSAAFRTWVKGWRAAALTIVLVTLAWFLVRSGIASALASELRSLTGEVAVVTVPLLGALGGYLTGSNTGAGGLSMPVATAFGDAPADLAWIAAAAIVAGSLMTALSPVRMTMGQGLAQASDRDVALALRLLLTYATTGLLICVIAKILI